MKAEIIAVGTELLMGQIANTNAQFLSQKLGEQGIDVFYHTVVGDNHDRLLDVLRLASARSNVIVLTGGLGPTQDDLTRETVAEFVGQKLVTDALGRERVEALFRRRNIEMPPNNIRQAHVIEGAHVFPNDHGLALGMAYKANGIIYILLPGPPFELHPMFTNYAIPYLQKQRSARSMLFSRVLRFYGIGESLLESKLEDLITAQTDPTIAPYAKPAEMTLRITTKAATEVEAEAKIAPIVTEIKARVGEFMYGEGDAISLEGVVLQTLKERNQTLACAESCTGGLISKKITEHAGVSIFFKGGIVCYSDEAKMKLLNIDQQMLATHGAVSEEVARALAENVRTTLDTDWGISVTGVAGPDPVMDKPVGLVYIGIAGVNGTEVLTKQFAGTRKSIQTNAAKTALFQLWKRMTTHIER